MGSTGLGYLVVHVPTGVGSLPRVVGSLYGSGWGLTCPRCGSCFRPVALIELFL